MNWKQRLGIGWMVLLVAAAVCVAIAVPARTPGDRALHAFFAVVALGVVGVGILFGVFVVTAIRASWMERRKNAT